MEHIIPFKGYNYSGCYDINLLYNSDKIFIMDNHLCAIWCWLQKIDIKKQYDFMHIDRHYDLLTSHLESWIDELKCRKIDLKKISINELSNLTYDYGKSDTYPLFRYDNYLPIFQNIYPNLVDNYLFATHKEGDPYTGDNSREIVVDDIPDNLGYWIRKNKNPWIVNLDIDYFFTERNDTYFQFLSDEYLDYVSIELKKVWNKIDVLTIALSPEYCGGWENSLRALKIVTNRLDFKYNF